MWGGEAAAVRHDGRANPNQLVLNSSTVEGIAGLRDVLVGAHADSFHRVDDLVVGLQLTHSGRWARPEGEARPLTARRYPALDARQAGSPSRQLTDDDLDELVGDFVAAAVLAARSWFRLCRRQTLPWLPAP